MVLLYAVVFLFTFHEADEDLWGRLAVGRLVADAGSPPRHDVFAYVPTKPLWVDHEWLSGVVFYQTHRLLGEPGLLVVRAATGTAAVALAFAVALSSGARLYAVVLLGLAVLPLLLQGYNGVVRAQSFSFAGFSLVLWLCRAREDEEERDSWGQWLGIAALFALWANLHGGVAAGLALIAVLRPKLLLPAAGASLLNPYGFHYWTYLARALAMPRPEIAEWQPGYPDLHLQLGAALVLATIVLGRSAKRDELDRRCAIAVLGILVASLLHVRFAPFLGLAVLAFLPSHVEAAFSRLRPSAAVGFMGLLLGPAFLGSYVALDARSLDFSIAVPPERYPVAAVERLETSSAEGAIAVYFDWGEYVLYRLHPKVRVSFDGRYETVYPDDIVAANWDLTRGRSSQLLQDYPPHFALYPRASGAARLLAESTRFRLVYEDAGAVLYEAVEESQVIR